jgi:septal ring factor EnvC (AmiA/AmiB activator)
MADNPIQDNVGLKKNTQEMERIREIVFGNQMRTYDQNLATLRQDLSRLQQMIVQLQEQLNNREQDQSRRLQALRREMSDADDSIRAELRQSTAQLFDEKVDRSILGELFIELGSQIKSGGSLNNLLQDLFGSDASLES